jgi:hypothetical protein
MDLGVLYHMVSLLPGITRLQTLAHLYTTNRKHDLRQGALHPCDLEDIIPLLLWPQLLRPVSLCSSATLAARPFHVEPQLSSVLACPDQFTTTHQPYQ